MANQRRTISAENRLSRQSLIHFVGIGGSGMSAIARICLAQGYRVSGSDIKESVNTIRLKDLGAKIFYGHVASNVRAADLLVVSGAIDPNNDEIVGANQKGIPVWRRAEMLAELMSGFSHKISVAGTHGKTTTTSMVTSILDAAQEHPTYLIGADMNDFGGNAALGSGPYFVAESDESDGSFLDLVPNIGIITNIEAEHMNYFGDLDNLLDHFQRFVDGIFERDGYVVVNMDDANLSQMARQWDSSRWVGFGLRNSAELGAQNIQFHKNGVSFDLVVNGQVLQSIRLKVFGQHNVYNALAAIGVGLREGLDIKTIAEGLQKFSGTRRRFQVVGQVRDITVMDDYGHHPTEIKATLAGARSSLNCRIVCVFQPHRYTRTQYFMDEFATAFDSADVVIITPVYAANEPPIPGVTSEKLGKLVQAHHPGKVYSCRQKSQVYTHLLSEIKPGDMVITMGAGDIHTVAKELVNRLKIEEGEAHH